MHVDPMVTDAYNALIRGHKWWVYLPKDIYEFQDTMTCDKSCSDYIIYDKAMKEPDAGDSLMIDDDQMIQLWFQHMLPQIR